MTILIVVAVVMLSVRIAAVMVWLVQHQENRVRFGPHERKTGFNRQIRTLRLPAQDYLTKDNVPVRVDAVVYFRVVDVVQAPGNASNYHVAMSQLAHTSLASVIGTAERDDLLSNRDVGAEITEMVDTTRRGPQDAPRFGPHDAAGNPQDATSGQQESARAGVTIAQVEGSVEPLGPPSHGKPVLPDLKADLPYTSAVAKGRGATKAARDFAVGRRMSFVKRGHDDGSVVPAGYLTRERGAAVRKTILDSVPRPAAGPACLGGRGNAGYLRGWDDAVDWLGQGNQAHPPTWGDVAYMTGWNDASRALAKAGLGAKTWPAAENACSTR
jgi:SPFH domain / Band 7 family